jgi:hypothetical protein
MTTISSSTRPVALPRQPEPRRARFTLAAWSPRAILARGGTSDRDAERAYGELRAIAARRG